MNNVADESPKKRCRNALKNLTITLFAVLFVLLSIEVILRFLYLNKNLWFKYISQKSCAPGLHQYDQYLGWKNKPNFNGVCHWPHRDTIEKTNSQGWRDIEHKITKGNDTYRIAVLGCSQTYGYGVNSEETYPKVLEKLLNHFFTKNFEVLNFGVNGYGLCQMVLNYDNYVKKYNPDLVILQLYLPNAYRVSQTKIWGAQKPTFTLNEDKLHLKNYPVPKSKYRNLLEIAANKSMLFEFLKNELFKVENKENKVYTKNIKDNVVLQDTCAAILKLFKSFTKRDHCRLIVFTWGDGKEWIKSICNKAGVEVFILGEYEPAERWQKIGGLTNPNPIGHWSVIGHSFVASAIYKYLDKKNQEEGIFNY